MPGMPTSFSTPIQVLEGDQVLAMSSTEDSVLASSSLHPSRGNVAEDEFFCRKCLRPFCTLQPLKILHTDGYMTCLPEGEEEKGKSVAYLLSLSKENNVLCNDLVEKNSLHNGSPGHDEQRTRNIDVTTFGSLCVDIVLNVPTLPPASFEGQLEYLNNLSSSSPDEKFWEAGGNSNFAIAAARLGLHCAALGYIGYDKYGSFLHEVLEKEGVQVIRLQKENIETLLCWVLVDPDHNHGFACAFDFNEDPAYKWIKELPACAKEVIQKSKVLFCDSYIFGEMTPEMITSTVEFAREAGCLVFFDPGPCGKSLLQRPIDQQQAFHKLLSVSNVLLLTADEAEALTGIANPMLSAKELLARGCCTEWVVVKMGDKGCLMATANGLYRVPGFVVDVKDTVGCGDSFAAAIALGYMRGLRIADTLVLANAVGAATAMGHGAGRNVATLDDVQNILVSFKVCSNCDSTGPIKTFSSG